MLKSLMDLDFDNQKLDSYLQLCKIYVSKLRIKHEIEN